MDDAPAFLFGKEPTNKDDRRLKVIEKMLKDLDWLYTTARDSGAYQGCLDCK